VSQTNLRIERKIRVKRSSWWSSKLRKRKFLSINLVPVGLCKFCTSLTPKFPLQALLQSRYHKTAPIHVFLPNTKARIFFIHCNALVSIINDNFLLICHIFKEVGMLKCMLTVGWLWYATGVLTLLGLAPCHARKVSKYALRLICVTRKHIRITSQEHYGRNMHRELWTSHEIQTF